MWEAPCSLGDACSAFQLPNKPCRCVFRCDVMFSSTKHGMCCRHCGDFSPIVFSLFFLFSLSSQNKFSPYFFFFLFFFTLLHNGYFFNLFLSILIWHILFFSNLVLICLNFLFYFWPFCESIVYFQINPQF